MENFLRSRQTPSDNRHPAAVANAVAQIGGNSFGELIGKCPEPQSIATTNDNRLPWSVEEEARSRFDFS